MNPSNITINIKNFDSNTNMLEVSIVSDIEDIPESRNFGYQIHSFASNSDIQTILKKIAISGLNEVRKQVRHKEISSNTQLINELSNLVNQSVTFTVNELENVVVYPVSNTAQEVLIP